MCPKLRYNSLTRLRANGNNCEPVGRQPGPKTFFLRFRVASRPRQKCPRPVAGVAKGQITGLKSRVAGSIPASCTTGKATYPPVHLPGTSHCSVGEARRLTGRCHLQSGYAGSIPALATNCRRRWLPSSRCRPPLSRGLLLVRGGLVRVRSATEPGIWLEAF